MRITVRFVGPFRRYAGTESLALVLGEGATVRQALGELTARLESPFGMEIAAPLMEGTVASSILLLNRHNLRLPDGLESTLHEGDVLSFVPPMGGG